MSVTSKSEKQSLTTMLTGERARLAISKAEAEVELKLTDVSVMLCKERCLKSTVQDTQFGQGFQYSRESSRLCKRGRC